MRNLLLYMLWVHIPENLGLVCSYEDSSWTKQLAVPSLEKHDHVVTIEPQEDDHPVAKLRGETKDRSRSQSEAA